MESSKSSTRRKQSSLVQHYLAGYNLLQFFGWGYGLILALRFLSTSSQRQNYRLLWEEQCSTVIEIFQTLQLMEVVHAAIKFVPSNPFTTFIQILSRLVLVWGILYPIPESRSSIGVPMLLVAWCIAECTRYIYYALNIYDVVPYICTWLRYSLFYVLYPLGVAGELITTYSALEPIRKRKFLTLELPNALNISFYYDIMCILFMLSYFHFFPQLYLYMIGQRKKILCGGGSKKD